MTDRKGDGMLEKMARAIYEEMRDGPCESERALRRAREIARAALMAMREPTEAMIDATDEHDNYWGYMADGNPSGPKDCWTAMIDAILAEGGGE